jgi:hypothetical protein
MVAAIPNLVDLPACLPVSRDGVRPRAWSLNWHLGGTWYVTLVPFRRIWRLGHIARPALIETWDPGLAGGARLSADLAVRGNPAAHRRLGALAALTARCSLDLSCSTSCDDFRIPQRLHR